MRTEHKVGSHALPPDPVHAEPAFAKEAIEHFLSVLARLIARSHVVQSSLGIADADEHPTEKK